MTHPWKGATVKFDGETQMLTGVNVLHIFDRVLQPNEIRTIEQDIMDGKFRAPPGREPTLMFNGEPVDFTAIGEALGAVSQ